jgi:hypothetical protein
MDEVARVRLSVRDHLRGLGFHLSDEPSVLGELGLDQSHIGLKAPPRPFGERSPSPRGAGSWPAHHPSLACLVYRSYGAAPGRGYVALRRGCARAPPPAPRARRPSTGRRTNQPVLLRMASPRGRADHPCEPSIGGRGRPSELRRSSDLQRLEVGRPCRKFDADQRMPGRVSIRAKVSRGVHYRHEPPVTV